MQKILILSDSNNDVIRLEPKWEVLLAFSTEEVFDILAKENKNQLDNDIFCIIISITDNYTMDDWYLELQDIFETYYNIPYIGIIENKSINEDLIVKLINIGHLYNIYVNQSELGDLHCELEKVNNYYNKINKIKLPKTNMKIIDKMVYCDDENVNLESFNAYFRRFVPYFGNEISIITTTKVEDTINEIWQSETSIILSDHRKPGYILQGDGLFQKIFSMKPSITRICLSASAINSIDDMISLIRKGKINKIISKPFNTDEMTYLLNWGLVRYYKINNYWQYYIDNVLT